MQRPSALYEFDAMGTRWLCELFDVTEFPGDLTLLINQTVKEFIDTYSRFDPNSNLSKLNHSGAIRNPSKEFVAMMKFVHEMFIATDGVFNISVGGTLHGMGYGSRDSSNRVNLGFWDDARVSEQEIAIPSGVTIDFGGFGKGWLIDVLGRLFRANGYDQFIINGGGDMLVSSDEPVSIALENPDDLDRAIGTIQMTHGALGVSAATKRRWRSEGEIKHHIIDPFLDDSAVSDVKAAYVKADSALIADTIATVLFIRPELAEKLHSRYSFSSMTR